MWYSFMRDPVEAVLMRHFGLTADQAELEAEWLVHSSFSNPPPFVWKQEDRRHLDEFWRALRTIATIDERLSPGASEGLRNCFVRHYLPKDVTEIPEYEKNFEALRWLDKLHERMRPVIPLVEAEIAKAPPEGQTKWDGVAVIGACRGCWWRNTGEEAPARGLNLASPFGNFVQDVFEVWDDLDVTAAAAFKAWARQQVPR